MRYIQNHGNKRRKIAGKFLIFIFIVVLMAAGIFSGCSTKESSLRQESESQQLKQDGREKRGRQIRRAIRGRRQRRNLKL